jgi:serine/threonine protein kinase
MIQPASQISQPGSADRVFADLVEELTAKLQAGGPVDIDLVARDHPEHAENLRKLLPALEVLGELSRSGKERFPLAFGPEADAGPPPGRLGDFRIVREVGRGGMGVVYEAEQVSLSRRVALKVLPLAGTLDPRHLQRFQNEARAAACLHHTNIVPVHAVGCERGVHFYAMQFIDGQTLAEVIRQLRQPASQESGAAAGVPPEERTMGYPPPGGLAAATEPAARQSTLVTEAARGREYHRRVAGLGVQAAEALDHAHQAGIVHRDVKPANLMLDARGALWVTDFGLAHVQQAEASLTATGDLVGTLRYMSPEQALGQRVVIDHRTDVYSLGVTLYELLTLEPAFGGSDRQELLRQIAFEEPKAPRRIDKSIPAELETIVQKAMAKGPAERYATAQEMADDLRCFLDDKPIRARRPTLGQRLGRWSRRHQAVVRSAVAVLVLAVIALATSTVLIAKAQKRAQDAYEGEVTQRQVAQEKAAEADAVVQYLVNDLLGSAAPEKALGRKVTVEEVLANAEKKIDGALADQPRVEAAVRQTMGLTYLRLARYAEAERHLLRARELYARWYGPESPETLDAMANLSNLLMAQGRMDEAGRLIEELLGLQRKVLGQDHPDTLRSMYRQATILCCKQDKREEGRRLTEEVLERQRRVLGQDHPDTLRSMYNLAVVRWEEGKLDEAERLFEEVLGQQQKVLGENHPATLRSLNGLATVLAQQDKLEKARPLWEETLVRQRRVLPENHPDTLNTMGNLAEVLRQQGKVEEARGIHEEMLVRRRKVLPENHPATVRTMDALAWLLATCDDPKVRDLARAADLATRATTLAPQRWKPWTNLGVARYRTGDWKGAAEALEKAVSLREEDAYSDSADWFFLAMAKWQLGDKERARASYDRAVQWMDKNKPQDAELARFRAEAAALLGIKEKSATKAKEEPPRKR